MQDVAGITNVALAVVDVPGPYVGHVSTHWNHVFPVRPVYIYVGVLAPGILVNGPVAEGPDCHWYVMPPAEVAPVRLSVNDVVALPDVGVIDAVPAVGVPEHAEAPVPVTATLYVDVKPPPVIAILLL